jgi:hypothetical protein
MDALSFPSLRGLRVPCLASNFPLKHYGILIESNVRNLPENVSLCSLLISVSDATIKEHELNVTLSNSIALWLSMMFSRRLYSLVYLRRISQLSFDCNIALLTCIWMMETNIPMCSIVN